MKDIVQKTKESPKSTENIEERANENDSSNVLETSDALSWSTLEYPYFEKGTLWYTVLALVAAGLIILAFATGDIILALLVIFGALTIGILGARKPEEITVTVEGTTLHVGEETMYSLEEMQSFWIHYEPPDDPELLLHSSGFFVPLITIPMGDQDPLSLRKHLRQLLPEEKEEVPLTKRVARALRF